MLTTTWRRLGSPFWLAIGLMALAPALAEAQLFPNRTIRREKPPCTSENPYYKQVRTDYFGYYPTCWRRFPDGWGCPCPNPELSGLLDAFRKEKIDLDRKTVPDGYVPEGSGDPMDGPNGPDRGNPRDENPAPLPRNTRSPFNLDDQPQPNTNPGNVKPPANTGDPFTDPPADLKKPGTGGTIPPPGNPTGPTSMRGLPAMPEISPSTSLPPGFAPGSIVTVADATLASTDNGDLRPDLGPLPGAPLPSSYTPANGTVVTETDPSVTTSAPVQAPKRKGFLSSLFNRGNTRNR